MNYVCMKNSKKIICLVNMYYFFEYKFRQVNSEAEASEFLKSPKQLFLRYWMHNNVFSGIKSKPHTSVLPVVRGLNAALLFLNTYFHSFRCSHGLYRQLDGGRFYVCVSCGEECASKIRTRKFRRICSR